MGATDRSLPTGVNGALIPDLSFDDAVAWCLERERGGETLLWANGDRDPILLLAAVAQRVERVFLGLFISDVYNRPPLMAAKQLMTLFNLSGGRLNLLVDIEDARFLALDQEMEKLAAAEKSRLPRLWRPNLPS